MLREMRLSLGDAYGGRSLPGKGQQRGLKRRGHRGGSLATRPRVEYQQAGGVRAPEPSQSNPASVVIAVPKVPIHFTGRLLKPEHRARSRAPGAKRVLETVARQRWELDTQRAHQSGPGVGHKGTRHLPRRFGHQYAIRCLPGKDVRIDLAGEGMRHSRRYLRANARYVRNVIRCRIFQPLTAVVFIQGGSVETMPAKDTTAARLVIFTG